VEKEESQKICSWHCNHTRGVLCTERQTICIDSSLRERESRMELVLTATADDVLAET